MRYWLCLLGWFAGVLSPLVAAIPGHSTSASRQFIIYCDDRSLRQDISDSCDDIRQQTLNELGLQAGFHIPILVVIQPRATNDTTNGHPLRWIDTPEGPKLQIDVLISDEDRDVRLRELVIEAVLLTIKYSGVTPDSDEPFARPPDWLIEGLSETFKARGGQLDPSLYQSLLSHRKTPDMRDFLTEDPATMDATGLGLYRAYACAFFDLLQSQPSGKKLLVAYLQKVPADRDKAFQLLGKTFPKINESPASLQKWWTLSLAKLSASDRYTLLGTPETERQLIKALSINLPDLKDGKGGNYTLEQFADFQKRPESRLALALAQRNLFKLALKANALYRPVIGGYQQVFELLLRGKTKDLSQKLATLTETRQQILQRVDAVADYLNWMEATQMPGKTGEFDSYLNLVNSYDQPRPPSKEPIGKYLDAMEAELKN